MKFLFYFGHPVQYLSMREPIRRLLTTNNLLTRCQERRQYMLHNIIDVTPFWIDF